MVAIWSEARDLKDQERGARLRVMGRKTGWVRVQILLREIPNLGISGRAGGVGRGGGVGIACESFFP